MLENCSKVLEYFVGDAKSIRSRCLTARDTLVDKLVDRYRHAMTSFFEEVRLCCGSILSSFHIFYCFEIFDVYFYLFLLCRVKSDFDETWCELYDGMSVHSYRADFEYLHKLCYLGQRDLQNTVELFQLRGSSTSLLLLLKLYIPVL